MKKIIISILAILMLSMPSLSGAQELDLSKIQQNLPGPFSDLVNLIQKVRIDTPNVNLTGSTGQMNISSGDISNIWQNINNWFLAHIGVSLTSIIKAVLNIIIWIWQLIISLLQSAVQHL